MYVDTGNMELNAQVCFIPNRTTILSAFGGLTYTILFGADTA